MTVGAQNIRGQVSEYTLSGVGVTDWIPLKTDYNPWECTFKVSGDAAAIAAGTLLADLEFVISTDPDSEPPECISKHSQLTGVVTCKNDKLEYAASHVRLNVTAHTVGVARLSILQPGSRG